MTAAVRKPRRPPPAAEWVVWRDHAHEVIGTMLLEGYAGPIPPRRNETWRDYAIRLGVMLMCYRMDSEPLPAPCCLFAETGPSR